MDSLVRILGVVVFLAPVLADVRFTKPVAGDVIDGTSFTIQWEESGIPPLISDFVSSYIYLLVGGNKLNQTTTMDIVVQKGTHNNATITFNASTGENIENAYFVWILSSVYKKETPVNVTEVSNFSDRFSLSRMNGTFKDASIVLAGLATLSGTTLGPPTEDDYFYATGTTIIESRVIRPDPTTSSVQTTTSSTTPAKTTKTAFTRSTAATNNATSPPEASASSAASSVKSSGMSAAVGAGIAIAGIVVFLIFASMIFCVWRKRRRTQALQNPISNGNNSDELKPQLEDTSIPNKFGSVQTVYELSGNEVLHDPNRTTAQQMLLGSEFRRTEAPEAGSGDIIPVLVHSELGAGPNSNRHEIGVGPDRSGVS